MSVAHYIRSNLTIPLQQAAKLLYGVDICSKCNKAIVFLDGAPMAQVAAAWSSKREMLRTI